MATVPCTAGDVNRCTENGKTIYSDRPCGSGATKVPIRNASPLGPEGTAVKVSDAVIKECFDGYRILARDPTTAKNIGHVARIVPAGFPVLTVLAVFTNKYGGPDNTRLWCKLTVDLQIDEEATAERQRRFYEQQRE